MLDFYDGSVNVTLELWCIYKVYPRLVGELTSLITTEDSLSFMKTELFFLAMDFRHVQIVKCT